MMKKSVNGLIGLSMCMSIFITEQEFVYEKKKQM